MPDRQGRITVDGFGNPQELQIPVEGRFSQPQVIPGAAVPSSPTGPSNGQSVACDAPAQPPAAPISPSQPTNVLDSESSTTSRLPGAVVRLAPHNNPGWREFPKNAHRQGGERRDEW